MHKYRYIQHWCIEHGIQKISEYESPVIKTLMDWGHRYIIHDHGLRLGKISLKPPLELSEYSGGLKPVCTNPPEQMFPLFLWICLN